jgi:diketogulonate reductase-like aldo/keto reductase
MELTTKCGASVMPRVGLGVWKIPRDATKEAVLAAITAGYRAIDVRLPPLQSYRHNPLTRR